MDANKKAKLAELGYAVKRCCGLCVHGKFRPGNDFGDCAAQSYKHLKHTGDAKPLSIVRFGSCPGFEADPAKVAFIHNFVEFLEES